MKKLLLLLLPIFILTALSQPTRAQAPTLGAAGDFALFTTTGAVTNTGNSFITGNVGTNSGAITGFGNVNGVMHAPDGVTIAAAADLLAAYNLIMITPNTGTHAPALGNETFIPGVYAISGNSVLNGNLTLDAQNDPSAVFIFKMDATFTTGVASQITLINGAMACNVFWKAEGAVNIASQSIMRGTVIAKKGAIDLATGVIVDGRILSIEGAITLLNSSAKISQGCGRPIPVGPAAPDLKSVGCYAIFSGTGEVTNSGITTVKGDIGTDQGLTSGYDPLMVNGTIHTNPDPSTAAARADLGTAYTYLNTLPYDIELLYPAQFGHDLVLTPHTYIMKAATSLTGTVFLNGEGNADAVFVIQINGALTTGTNAKVVLTNGTQAKNVYWKVDGAVSIAGDSQFKGTIIANNGAIDLATGVNLEGRILTTVGAVTTDAVTVTSDKVCSVPNLSPVIVFVPNNITNTTDIGVVLSVYEYNSVSTSGLITVLIQKDPKYVLAFNPTATSVFGRSVSNASWTFDPSSNSGFYVLTTTAVIPADGVLNVGFTTTFNPNNTKGSTPIFSIILEGSGSETYDLDNTSFDKLTYKIQ